MVIPKDDTDEAGWNAVYGKLGRPDKPDGYKVPDQIKDDPLVTEFSTHAHKLGLTARQYEETMKWVVERTTARQTETEQAREAEFAKASDALKRSGATPTTPTWSWRGEACDSSASTRPR